jgi:acetoin utilization protein AcuB
MASEPWQDVCDKETNRLEDSIVQIVNWMTSNPICVGPGDTLEKAGALLASGGFRQLPVVEKDKLVGIITDRDLRQHKGYFGSTRVDAAMTAPAVAINRQESAEAAAKLLIKHKIGALPVIEGEKVIGIVTTVDLLRALLCVVEAAKEVIEQ